MGRWPGLAILRSRREAELRSRAKSHTTAAPTRSSSTGRRSTQRHDSHARTSAAVPKVITEEKPAAKLKTPNAQPRSRGAHQAAMSRLAGANPSDCA
jgi:hypothetical protein